MKDLLGIGLDVGDRVAYGSVGQGDAYISTGTIAEIVFEGNEYRAKLISESTGKTMPRKRVSGEILSLKWLPDFKKSNPQEFI